MHLDTLLHQNTSESPKPPTTLCRNNRHAGSLGVLAVVILFSVQTLNIHLISALDTGEWSI